MKTVIFAILVISAATASTKVNCVRNIVGLGPENTGPAQSVRAAYDVKELLMMHANLPKSMQSQIKACGLSLEGAKNRCVGSYSSAKCEQISDVAWQHKCD